MKKLLLILALAGTQIVATNSNCSYYPLKGLFSQKVKSHSEAVKVAVDTNNSYYPLKGLFSKILTTPTVEAAIEKETTVQATPENLRVLLPTWKQVLITCGATFVAYTAYKAVKYYRNKKATEAKNNRTTL